MKVFICSFNVLIQCLHFVNVKTKLNFLQCKGSFGDGKYPRDAGEICDNSDSLTPTMSNG